MAKYEDYVKDLNKLDDEIEDAGQNQQQRQEEAKDSFQMPKQFEGKSAEEIAKSYAELQKLNSRQAQDLGKMRSTVDQLLDLQSRQDSKPPEKEQVSVDIDDLYDNPTETISKVAKEAVEESIKEIADDLEETKRLDQLKVFEEKHSNWRDLVEDDTFIDWVKGSNYRTRLAQAADQYDFDAANDLFDMYEDYTSQAEKKEKAQKREKQLQDAGLESATPAVVDTDETFSRTNLLQARMAAKQGDESARAWLANNAEAIRSAYEERRITD